MNEKIDAAHKQIEGTEVAAIIQDFYREFRGVYREDVMTSSLCAVGPLQSMIGLAIKNGRLSVPKAKQEPFPLYNPLGPFEYL